VVGTPAYMSPEQGRAERGLDGRSDIYSLGAILFEMLSGHVPYEAETPTGQIVRHITDPIPNILESCPDLPVECQAVINKAMAKKRGDRFDTTTELAQALSAVSQGKPIPTPPEKLIIEEAPKAVSQPTLPPLKPVVEEARVVPEQQPPASDLTGKKRLRGRYPIGVWIGAGVALLLCLIAGFGWLQFPSIILKPKQSQTFTPTTHLTETFTITPRPSATEIIAGVTQSPTLPATFTRMPTSSPRPIPSSSLTPTIEYTHTPTPEPMAEVIAANANLYSGPGMNYDYMMGVPIGDKLLVVGRNSDGTWLEVFPPGHTITGWILSQKVKMEVDIFSLPTVEIPPTSTPTFKPIPTSTRSPQKRSRTPPIPTTAKP
jgi:serine/threonine protein kinase